MAKQYINDGGPDGAVFGQSSTDLIGFYGLSTPVARQSAGTIITATATTTAHKALTIALRLALVNLGLIA
jgi:hypothetical protein